MRRSAHIIWSRCHFVLFLQCLISLPVSSGAQETKCNITGIIRSVTDPFVHGATITVIHQSTRNRFISVSREDGRFYFTGLPPGGPFEVRISHMGFETLIKDGVYAGFSSPVFIDGTSETEIAVFTLALKQEELPAVRIQYPGNAENVRGSETTISRKKMESMPTISRNLQDYIRLVPQSKVNGDGLISLAGQNNRYNNFFIDGAPVNDLLGTSISGTHNGELNTPPVSIELIESIKVSLTPYHARFGNFSGGNISIITASGSNAFKLSAWYNYRNQHMAGRTPVNRQYISHRSGERTLLPPFVNQTYGLMNSGYLIRDKLFYLISFEQQTENRPQVYSFSHNPGSFSEQEINKLTDTLKARYGYDPGSVTRVDEILNAKRLFLKLNYNPGDKNKLALTWQYKFGDRISPRPSGGNALAFSNNSFRHHSDIQSLTLEWNTYLNNRISNHLVANANWQSFIRNGMGRVFPQVTINDGRRQLFFGMNGASHLTEFNASDFSLTDILYLLKDRHHFSAGVDLNTTLISDLFVGGYFGIYQFRTVEDFLLNKFALQYERSFPLRDQSGLIHDPTSRFRTYRLSPFINDEVYLNKNLKIQVGLRVDGNLIPRSYQMDHFLRDTALKIIGQYYATEGAGTGKNNLKHWQVSPRISVEWKIPAVQIQINGGSGIFAGKILNVWPSALYNTNRGGLRINPISYNHVFNPDPNAQPDIYTPGYETGAVTRETNLLAEKFRFPTMLRSSMGVQKKFNRGWKLSTEFIYTYNIHENAIRNINILPADKNSAAPGSRNVYSLLDQPSLIPLLPDGSNPYSDIILLYNNEQSKGRAWNWSIVLEKSIRDKLDFTAGYHFGRSLVLYEPYYNATPLSGQWTQYETVNGKNNAVLSVSDVDPGHRIFADVSRKIKYRNQQISTTVSLFYNGQSGQPYSYVYFGSIINDAGRWRSHFDLIYIPTQDELKGMAFLPLEAGGNLYQPDDQRKAFNDFIEQDPYLRRNRGSFAKRNGARLPFSHIIDIRLKQDFIIKIRNRPVQLGVTLDIFNFTNLLNRKWGNIYFMANDNYRLVEFRGFRSNASLEPLFQFNPENIKPYSLHSSTAPGNSARWISQLGFRISF